MTEARADKTVSLTGSIVGAAIGVTAFVAFPMWANYSCHGSVLLPTDATPHIASHPFCPSHERPKDA